MVTVQFPGPNPYGQESNLFLNNLVTINAKDGDTWGDRGNYPNHVSFRHMVWEWIISF